MSTDDHELVRIRILRTESPATPVRLLRSVTTTSIRILSQAIGYRTPIDLFPLFGLDHGENTRKLLALLRELEGNNVEYELLIGARAVTFQNLQNRLESWRQISYDLDMEAEWASGEPSAEAKAWATGKL